MREASRLRSVILRASVSLLLGAVLVSPVPAKPTANPAAITAAADLRTPDSVPCDSVSDAILRADGGKRIELSQSAIRRGCRPAPPPIWSAVRHGRWTDGHNIDQHDRAVLLGLMTAARYPEAETLAVDLLQDGHWPDNSALGLEQGSLLIQGLKSSLTPYRVHLLLDIYEQRSEPLVRVSVLQALTGSDLPEALLPAVDACLADSGQTRSVALGIVSAQPERTADGVLARLIRDLPEGSTAAWARKLGEEHPSEAINSALKKRGASKTG